MKYIRLNFPTELEFEPIQLCNAKCFCCPYTELSEDKEYVKQKMTREEVENLLVNFGELLRKYNYNGKTTINPFRYSDPLVYKDIDVVFKVARKYGLKIQITTNAKGFNNRNLEILDEYDDCLKDEISISILGDTEENVYKNMKISLNKTFETLKNINSDKIKRKLVVSLRIIEDTKEEIKNLLKIKDQFNSIGIVAKIKRDWLNNRIGGDSREVSEEYFIKGCKLHNNKLLRRMEVMVNGDVVLCDDDAIGRKKFGNVFSDSIEKIWNGDLKEYHNLIFNKKYSTKKKDLICNNCSRAIYGEDVFTAYDSIKEIGHFETFKQLVKGNIREI